MYVEGWMYYYNLAFCVKWIRRVFMLQQRYLAWKFNTVCSFWSFSSATILPQGCQMVCFQNKNPNLGQFRRALDWKMIVYFWPLEIFYGDLRCFMTIWYILYSFGTFFGIMYQEKSGYPVSPYAQLIFLWLAGGRLSIRCHHDPQTSKSKI
jgi:hypothetical protein